jgi:hypothetical protein
MFADNWHVTITGDAITLAIAILGAALGIWNSLYNWRRDRVILRVKPLLYAGVQGGRITWDRPVPQLPKLVTKESSVLKCKIAASFP